MFNHLPENSICQIEAGTDDEIFENRIMRKTFLGLREAR